MVIKRHRLLEHQFQTYNIYGTPPVPDELGSLHPIPTIDQFRVEIIQALYVEEGMGPGIYPLGTWVDHEGL